MGGDLPPPTASAAPPCPRPYFPLRGSPRLTRWHLLVVAAMCAGAPGVRAQALTDTASAGPRLSALAISFAADTPVKVAPDTGETRPKAIEHSDAYYTRLAIHRYASYAELPLFAAEYVLGQKLLNDQRDGRRGSSGAHSAVAVGLGALFAVNTVTGVWNMVEARHDPAGRTRRNLHVVTMLLADAGFVWTASLAGGAKESEHGAERHRNAALVSIGVATASTLMMWLWKD